ncbi:MAG: hypothetical protein ACJ8AT_04810 [Hyalangium sp.]|uniref:hypothetical protein n=1 Tax=Hyalangium sp. TaxID=2028555 RepID=UPI00389A2338
MGLHRELAALAMRATPLPGQKDFLSEAGIAPRVPTLPGSIGAVAHEPFRSEELKRLFDLMVIFTMGDFPESASCSSYFDPGSPWYNVFYGAYGVRSHKLDGSPWGFRSDGRPNLDELLEVPWLDYNFLTAGCLGCPPSRMCFRVEDVKSDKEGAWHTAEIACIVPSGLHRMKDAVAPDLTYYAVFGVPEERYLSSQRESYEPVRMRGKMYFQPIAERTTLVWGGLCPDTPDGQRLFNSILEAMTPHYTR